jgi:hypothetical protein
METFGIQIPVWLLAAFAVSSTAGLLLFVSERRAGTLIVLHQTSRFAKLTRRADTVVRISIALWWGVAALYHWHGGSQAYALYDALTVHLLAAVPLWTLLRVICRIRFRTWDLWVDPWEEAARTMRRAGAALN